MADLTQVEADQVQSANQSDRRVVVFVHGLWLLPSSWDRWRTRFEAAGSPVVTDGEQRKYHNFWTYAVHGLPNTAPDGFKIPFSAGHVRRMVVAE